jgi:hypothetical protein
MFLFWSGMCRETKPEYCGSSRLDAKNLHPVMLYSLERSRRMKPDQPGFLSRRIVVAIFVVLSAGTAIALRGKWQGNEMNALLFAVMIGAVATNSQTAKAQGETARVPSNDVTAIDILLEPDATMLQNAQAVNDRLRKVFPQGFALDATHRPHISLVQRFVPAKDLDKVYAAVGKVFASSNVTGLKLEAFKYYYLPNKNLGLSGIVIKPTSELIKLELQVIDAVTPYAVKTGTSAAFVTTPENPNVLPELITYVSEFVPKSSGDNFHPHVSTGLAPREYLDKMVAEPFQSFTFSPAGAAVYHLGDFGTAAKKLKQFDLKH